MVSDMSDLQVDGDGLRVHFALPALELVLQSQQNQILIPLCQCEQVDSRGQRSLQPRELRTEKRQLGWLQYWRAVARSEGQEVQELISPLLTSSSVFGCKSPSMNVSSGCSTTFWARGR